MKNIIILALFVFWFAAGSTLTAKEKALPPKKFKSTDIGNPALEGKTIVLNDGLEITAGGADVWGKRDEFRFSYIEQTGDFDLVSRIESLSPTHLYTKAGIMARENLSDNCRHIFFQVFPDNKARNKNNGGYEFQYRKESDGEMKAIYPENPVGEPEFPVNYPQTWIRLNRSGNVFTGYYSPDGKSWKVYASFKLDLSKQIYLGLAVTSHDNGKTTTAIFKNIFTLK
ncbi:MAG: hypothetical protein WC384_18125 [Prolixibacteraceae bacterium]|jgi:hypothetical protein